MATISNNDIARSIYLLSKGKTGAELSNILHNVTKFLARKRLLSKANDILSRLKKIIDQENGILAVKVTSGKKLGEEIKKSLVHSLKERYRVRDVNFIEKQDENLLGGVKIEANDEIIDLTVKNKIEKLKEYLTRPA